MGQVDLNPAPVGTVKNMDNILANLKNTSRKNIPDGEWIFGWGYDDGELAEKRHPTKKILTKYCLTIRFIYSTQADIWALQIL